MAPILHQTSPFLSLPGKWMVWAKYIDVKISVKFLRQKKVTTKNQCQIKPELD